MNKPSDKFKVLVLALVDPSGNPRPKRIIELCRAQGARVHVASYPSNMSLDVDRHYIFGRPSSLFRQRLERKIFALLYRFSGSNAALTALNERRWRLSKIKAQLQGQAFDLLIVEDLYLLPFALEIRHDAKLIFDAREYYPEQTSNNLWWRLTVGPAHLIACRRYLKLCDAMMTVSPGLAARYEHEFGVKAVLVRSTPVYRDLPPRPVPADRVRIVHHGNPSKGRMLERMIETFALLDGRFELDFYLQGNDHSYIEELKKLASPYGRIRFLPPVPFDQIAMVLNNYDIGFCLLAPSSFNLRFCLPNKLFEYIQASLAVAIGPSPDMAEVIQHYSCGVITDNFDAGTMAHALNALDATAISHLKEASYRAAKELCFEQESEKIIALIGQLLPGQMPASGAA